MKTTFIYTLTDPITNLVRYIGKANNLSKRLEGHLLDKKKTHKANWIQSLKTKGLKPIIEEIDEVSLSGWQFWEQHYISLYKSWGFSLTNGTYGGEGFSDPTGEIRKKISKTLTGRKSAPGVRDKAIATRKKKFEETGKWAKDGTYEKIGKILKGKERTQQTKDQMSVSAKLAFKEGRRKVQGGAGISRPGKLNPVSRGVAQYDLQGNFIKEWESSKQAGESFESRNTNVIASAKGKTTTAHGFIWRYINPKENEPLNNKESVKESLFKIEQRNEFIRENLRKQQKLRWK